MATWILSPHSRKTLGVVVFVILLFGCSEKPTSIKKTFVCTPAEEKTVEYPAIAKELSPIESKFEVAGLAFTLNGTGILVAYASSLEKTGRIGELSVPTLQPIRSVNIPDLSSEFTRFNQSSDLVASAAKTNCPVHPYTKESVCHSVGIWKTSSGELIWMADTPSMDLKDVAISDDGKWVLRAKAATGISSTENKLVGASFSFNTRDSTEDIVSATLDRDGNLFALGFMAKDNATGRISGVIRLQEWDGRSIRDPVALDLGLLHFGPGQAKLDQPPQRLSFDLNHKWLAAKSQDSIQIYDTQSLSKYAQVDLHDNTKGVLAFNPMSNLLAVGYSSGLKILTVPGLQTVVEKSAKNAVSAVAFSSDGCLLTWGDANGTVHIMNSPKP